MNSSETPYTFTTTDNLRQLLSGFIRSLGSLVGRGRLANILHERFLSQGSAYTIAALSNCAKFRFNLDEMQQHMAFYLGDADRDMVGIITNYFLQHQPGDLFIDVGANIGIYAIQIATLCPNTRVIAFEPGEKNFKQLEYNIALNGLQQRVIPVKKALRCKNINHTLMYSHEGKNKDYSNAVIVSDWQNSLDEWKANKQCSEQIECVTFDSWLSSNTTIGRIGFVKIDVEGHEHEVIEGMKDTINAHRPVLFTEMNSFFLRMKNTNSLQGKKYFKKLSCSPYNIVSSKLVKLSNLKANTQNILWIPDELSCSREAISF